MQKLKIESGDVFFNWTIICEVDNTGNKHRLFSAKCLCENIKTLTMDSLVRGLSKSCGCKRGKHYKSFERIYSIWDGIKQRCMNPNTKYYKRYGGRGISICKEWSDDFRVFEKWALENGYSDSLTINRKENNKNYTPENCEFVSRKVQSNNRTNNILIEIDGIVKTIGEWADYSGIKYDTIWARVQRYGWTGNKILK
jgi:hypothetical protein